MGKKRKTLKQKKIAEFRRATQLSENKPSQEIGMPSPISYTFSSAKTSPDVRSYSLQHDLKKTLVVSVGILFFLTLLSNLLHNHAFVLPLIPLRY